MKKLNIAFVTAVSAIMLFVGCDNLLNTEPKQSIDSEQALTNSDNVKSVLVGAYDALGDDDLYGGWLLMTPDFLADAGDFRFTGTFFGPRQIWLKAQEYDNAQVTEIWTQAYETINITNSALAGLELVEEDERDRVEGEARFIRGVIYFELVRLFGHPYVAGQANDQPGVPLVLKPTETIDEESNVSRSSVEEVYTQIINDLTAARDLLGEQNPVRSYYANTYVASAFLSRVFLQQGNYAAARDEANRVIESGRYSLTEDYADAFNNVENSTEDIFAIQVSSQDGTNSMFTFYSADSRGDIDVEDAHIDEYESGDERLDLFYEDPADGARRSGKWNNGIDGNVNIVRLAEMYLTRAEANLREGTEVGDTPLNDINRVRNRVNLPDLLAGDLDIDAILHERKLELMFEGTLLHDIKRTQRSVGTRSYDANILVLPIPKRELEANPNITQNPGYQGS